MNLNHTEFVLHRDSDHILSLDYAGTSIGRVELYANPFHGQNQYLRLLLSRYENVWAEPLFSLIQDTVGRPLQVMVSSEDAEQVRFLLAGGFACRRKCYEMEVTARDCVAIHGARPLAAARQGEREYTICCRLLYEYYRTTHAAVNPLTAEFDVFSEGLPAEVLYETVDGTIQHVAFVEAHEIAYLGSTATDRILPFVESVAARLFAVYDSIGFECDDCDAAAMALKSLFCVENAESYDTYVREWGAGGL